MISDLHNIKSPSRIVWRTQMIKGVHTPHRVSKITCCVNTSLSEAVTDHLVSLGIQSVFVESGRNVRKVIKKRPFGLPGSTIRLQDTPSEVFRFTVPRDNSRKVVRSLIQALELYIPGRGTIFAQDLIEFSYTEPPRIIEHPITVHRKGTIDEPEIPLFRDLAYVTCVLSVPGGADRLAEIALELGICVPLITSGTATDIRDHLGLIRITLPPEKDIIHLVMPEQDSDSIFRILIDAVGLNHPGRGFIYRTPVSAGLIDTRLRIGPQENAATIEQIIAAIDQLKHDTGWRKRYASSEQERSTTRILIPDDNCEVTAICLEDRLEEMVEAAKGAGASGATTSRVKRLVINEDDIGTAAQVHSTISVPANITSQVVDALLEVSTIGDNEDDRIQVLDSPAAYVHNW